MLKGKPRAPPPCPPPLAPSRPSCITCLHSPSSSFFLLILPSPCPPPSLPLPTVFCLSLFLFHEHLTSRLLILHWISVMFWQHCTPESQNHALSGMLIPGFQDCCPPFSFATTCRKRYHPCTRREALEKPTLLNMQILFFNGKNWHMFTLKTGMNAIWEPGDILLVCGSSHHPNPPRILSIASYLIEPILMKGVLSFFTKGC